MQGPRASLDLTHVLYDDSSYTSLALALVTLSPILLMASYASLAVQTRELVILEMWTGQLACEGLNWLLKRAIKEDRPIDYVGNGYGWPSSHSQYMGFFASFLICHIHFRHRFMSTGYLLLDRLWRSTIYLVLASWAAIVAYSRYSLTYHTAPQIYWGLGIGISFGTLLYTLAELIPRKYPKSLLGIFRSYLVGNPISTWLGIRDGWAVWDDAGRQEEWKQWRARWEQAEISRQKRHD